MLRGAHRGVGRGTLRCSFTLVELLVVVSVIALLVSLLLPSLRRAREQAKEVVCGARLRQWGLAFACYANENNAYYPHCDGLDREDPPDPDNPDIPPKNAHSWTLANWHGWVDMLPPMIDRQAWRHFKKWEHPTERTFYQCPSGVLPRGRKGYKQLVKFGYFSYAMNSCLELDESAWRPPGGTDYPMPSFLDTARIVGPQRVVLLLDQLLDPTKGYGGWELDPGTGEHCGSYPTSFSARHRRSGSRLGGNLLFCDGHVDWQRTVWKERWGRWDIGGQQGPPRDDPNWYPYPAPKGASTR